ncbi:hypothetical protein LCGC14_0829010 [marine sediment metagenome]|uniref:Helicase ATP-binding domain-containing protein n=1 Tax=marine sediment metagenome TaxID=412755 RepID=A0A0F9SNZ8_9ZZZZ
MNRVMWVEREMLPVFMHKAVMISYEFPASEGGPSREFIKYTYELLVNHVGELQKAAYKLQGRMKFQDLDISIENKKGSVRKGTDDDGNEWRIKMNYPYGYIRLTEGTDGDHVDCYIGPDKDSKTVYVVHQNDPVTKKYDEDKVMLGFVTASSAKKAYLSQYDRPGFFGSMEKFSIEIFQDKVKRKKGKITGGDILVKAISIKRHYSKEDVKALNLRWVTVRGNHVLVQGLQDGGWVVVGGAGGKLNHFRLDELLSKEEYAKRTKEMKERELKELTPEQIKEQAAKRKAEIEKKRGARAEYESKIKDIVGAAGKDIHSMITMDEMDELEKLARRKVEKDKRKSLKEMAEGELDEHVKEQLDKEIKAKEEEKVKDLEIQAVNAIASDYMGDELDPNEREAIISSLDLETANRILEARRGFKKQIKEINIGKEKPPKKLRIGDTFAANSYSIKDEVLEEVRSHLETRKNVELYEKLNQQSLSIQKYIDQGSLDSLNGIMGDLYDTGAVFGASTIEGMGLEAVVRMIAIKAHSEGRADIVKDALMKYAQKNNIKIVQEALKESKTRFSNADGIRSMARDSDDEEAILSMASANGYALRQLVRGQQVLGSAVGSLRATAHLINALEEPPADSVLVDMGTDLARARKKAKKMSLLRGEYSMRSSEGRLIMEVPKSTLEKFFKKNEEGRKSEDFVDKIKMHEANTGYIPPGMNKGIKLFPSQEAGLRFFAEKSKVLLDFEAGIGKTAIGYAAAMEAIHNKGAKKVLIITPAKLRNQFYQDRKKFLAPEEQEKVMLNGEGVSPMKRHDNYLKEGINIIGHDQLRADANLLDMAAFDMIVIDEIHEMTNPETKTKADSQRYRGMMGLSDIPLKIGMSGTNIKNSKKELYKKINFIDPDHTLGSIKDFDERFKGLNQGTTAFAQSANEAFRKEIAPWVYNQKNAMDIKNEINEVRVKMTPEQRKAYKESERVYATEKLQERKRMGSAGRRDSRNYDIIHRMDSDANGKINFIVDKMDNVHSREKAVIHVTRIESMKTMQSVLNKKYGAGSAELIHGNTSKAQVEETKKKFNDPGDKMRFLIGTKSLENGHNLQYGGTVTFHLDVPQTYASFDQRNKRVYRRGQDKDVTTYLLVSDSPFDIGREDILSTKKRETEILGNPRAIEQMDDTGFMAILNGLEKEEALEKGMPMSAETKRKISETMKRKRSGKPDEEKEQRSKRVKSFPWKEEKFYAYHGTSGESVEKILESGLKPSGKFGENVYLQNEPERSVTYADPKSPVSLKVFINKKAMIESLKENPPQPGDLPKDKMKKLVDEINSADSDKEFIWNILKDYEIMPGKVNPLFIEEVLVLGDSALYNRLKKKFGDKKKILFREEMEKGMPTVNLKG